MIFPADDPVAERPRPTSLYAAAASSSEANLWTAVNGWSVSRVFTAVSEEYEFAKSHAGIADFGPLARYAVRGRDAAAFLSRVATAPAAILGVGESARGLVLDDEGGVVDLAEVSRLSTDLFLLTTPTAHARRLQLAARGLDASADNITGEVAAIGVLGPKARDVLSAAGMRSSSDEVAASAMVRGVETAARPFQFGVLPGVELIFPADEALTIWERLMRRGKVRPIGLDAMEILRIESGAPRPGVDFSGERSGARPRRSPAEIGLPHLAPLDSGWFNGRRALRRGPAETGERLEVIAVDADAAFVGAPVFAGGKQAGRLTSWALSPSLRRVIAVAAFHQKLAGKPLEIAAAPDSLERRPARLHETAEKALAETYEKSLEPSDGKRILSR